MSIMVEPLLLYYLSRYVLLSGPEVGINSYVFPMAICLGKGEKLALGPIYLGSLYVRLDECLRNILHFFGRYSVVTSANTCFIQFFLLRGSEGLYPGLQSFRKWRW